MKIYVVCETTYHEYDFCYYYSTKRKALDAFYTRIGEYMLSPHVEELPEGMSLKACMEWSHKEIDANVIKLYSIELDSQKHDDINFWTHPERHWHD